MISDNCGENKLIIVDVPIAIDAFKNTASVTTPVISNFTKTKAFHLLSAS